MSNFDEQLARAKAAPRQYKDVPVCLDADLAAEREALVEQLKKAQATDASDQRLGAPNDAATAPVQERLDALAEAARAAIVVLRFRRIEGMRWAELTSVHPPRPEVPIDRHYGYNYDAVCGQAAVLGGVRVETGEDGTETEIEIPAAQWDDLLAIISGAEVEEIRDAVWSLNEFEPTKRRDALVKGFGAAARSVTK